MIYTKTLSQTKSNPTNVLKKAMHVASCYGFDNIDKVIVQQKKQADYLRAKEDQSIPIKKQRQIKQSTKTFNTDLTADEVVQALKTAVDNELLPCKDSILLYQNNLNTSSTRDKSIRFGLIAMGMKKSIAEALIIKTAHAILEDIGVNNAQVYINSMGDRDSSTKFVNELNSYFRKNINSISPQIRKSIKKDIFKAYNQLYTKYDSSTEEIPQSIKFLSDKNRRHLSEVLEYMETVGISYEMDNFLIGDNNCYSQTLFEIRHPSESTNEDTYVLARGGRYDEIVKKMFNIDIPAVGIVLEFEKEGIQEKKIDTFKRIRKPKIYFIQLGGVAKKKSLPIIDTLRKYHIYTYHSLNNDKLAEQLSFAEHLNVPYSIIMGHREALDDTVIVRNMDTQFQHTVSINDLPLYLKEMHL